MSLIDEEADQAEERDAAENRLLIDLVRLIDNVEVIRPDRGMRMEAKLIWALAQRAGRYGCGPDFVHLVGEAIRAGEQLRDEQDGPDNAFAAAATTTGYGHA